MKKLCSLLSLCCLQCVLPAQTPSGQTISGEVIERDSKKPIIGATVRIKNSVPVLEIKTDVNGHFSFDRVPVGRWQVACVHNHYQPWLSDTISVDSARETILDIFLRESIAYRAWVQPKNAAQAKGILYQTTDSSLILLKYKKDMRGAIDSTQEILITDIKSIAIREEGVVGDSFAQGMEEGFELGSHDAGTATFCTLIGGLLGLINSPPKLKIQIDGKQALYQLNRDRMDQYTLAGRQ